MLRIVTSNSLAKWSRIFMYFLFLNHLNALKVTVSPSSLAESHGICSAAGAIYVWSTFTQSDGRLTIENSSAKLVEARSTLECLFGEVSRCCLIWL